MLLAPVFVALSLLAQSPPAQPVPAAVLAPLPVNSTVTLDGPGLAAVDLATLHELIVLVGHRHLSEDSKQAAYEAIKRAGRVLEFVETTRMVLLTVTPDKVYRDNRTHQPTLVYSGSLLDGPYARRTVFILGDQIHEEPRGRPDP